MTTNLKMRNRKRLLAMLALLCVITSLTVPLVQANSDAKPILKTYIRFVRRQLHAAGIETTFHFNKTKGVFVLTGCLPGYPCETR